LTITRRVIEQMGGTVNVKSEVGVGSTFWIDLPIDTLIEPKPAFASTGISTALEFVSHTGRLYTVLYIEDNPANIKLMTKLLGRHPHLKLISAHNPELGLELARTQRPDLVLLDINMPGMDGFQILEKFKLNVRMRAVPVIAVTAAALPADIKRGKEAGFNDYVTKPIDEAHFMTILENYVPRTAPAAT
jgi:CheY-like chemotaxis protein